MIQLLAHEQERLLRGFAQHLRGVIHRTRSKETSGPIVGHEQRLHFSTQCLIVTTSIIEKSHATRRLQGQGRPIKPPDLLPPFRRHCRPSLLSSRYNQARARLQSFRPVRGEPLITSPTSSSFKPPN